MLWFTCHILLQILRLLKVSLDKFSRNRYVRSYIPAVTYPRGRRLDSARMSRVLSVDTTPYKVTPVILHGLASSEVTAVILHGVVSPDSVKPSPARTVHSGPDEVRRVSPPSSVQLWRVRKDLGFHARETAEPSCRYVSVSACGGS